MPAGAGRPVPLVFDFHRTMASPSAAAPARPRSEFALLLLLAAVQFSHITDFMVMMPLGPQLIRELNLSTEAFGALISAFATTSGVVGLAMAPFADRFDRRRLLLFCYAGFVLGTLACALAHTFHQLLLARAVCGAFGGVSGATIMAIVADVVPPERRARGMGIIMTAFSAAAALGVPLGLKLAQWWRWEAPFFVVAGIAAVVWICLLRVLPPVRGHLTDAAGHRRQSGREFLGLLQSGNAWLGILLMVVLVLGHFTIIPYLSPFLVANVGMREEDLFLIYFVGGLVTIFTGPLIGKWADRFGRYRVYAVLVGVASVVIWALTHLTPRPNWQILLLAAAFFMFASARFIPGQASISLAVPAARRGAYMSLIACARDLAMGLAATVGAKIIVEHRQEILVNGVPVPQLVHLEHFDTLGWIAIGLSLLGLVLFPLVRSVEESHAAPRVR